MSVFFKDPLLNICISWDELISDILRIEKYNPYCYTQNYYEVFKQIIFSLIIDEEIILLDSDLSSSEIKALIGHSNFLENNRALNKKHFIKIESKKDLIKILSNSHKNWRMTLFTSGTTGLPKKVSHSFYNITRFVKISKLNSYNVWGFAYNPTHIAGIQVFLQAVLNGNSIIRLFGLSREKIYKEIKKNKITHISATPTFYRLLLPCNYSFPLVTRITTGGEKFDEKTTNQLQQVFPKAKITNIYASTEAGTLFASDGRAFTIKPQMEDLVRITEGELLIHKSLMGDLGYNMGEWYHSGDLVEIVSKAPLKFIFISRKNEMINVGGYKVNPYEVEEVIRCMPGIKDARIFSKSNIVLGNIICCEVVRNNSDIEEAEMRVYLQTKLQEFKIPRIIRFVDELLTTRTGKIKRIKP